MPRVYLETTIVSYLAAWPSPDLIVAGHQQITQLWWQNHRTKFELFVSQLVIQECAAGDRQASQRRLAFLSGINSLAITKEAGELAKDILAAGAIPPTSAEDALHLAVASVNSLDYLLTWNCRHLANATMRGAIVAAVVSAGYSPPIICTPEELITVP